MTKKEESLNLNLVESQVKLKGLHFLLVCFNENFKNQSLMDVQPIK